MAKAKSNQQDDSDFFDELLKKAGVDAPVVSKVDDVAVTSFFSTGSLLLNAAISGTMEGGFAGNKIVALAGEEATGKSFIALQAVCNFLTVNPTGHVFYFDSEDAVTESMMKDRTIDTSRVHKKRVKTIQEFRKMAINLIDAYALQSAPRRPMFFVLDSLGNLSTSKEMADIAKGAVNKKTGEETRDMTRAPLIRGLFRVLTIKLGEAGVGMLMTNHTYDTMDPYGAKKEMSGGRGLKFCASTIIFLSKKILRDTEDKKHVLGSILTATLEKSRFTRYGTKVELLLTHESGLQKYWGLFDLGKDSGLLVAGTGVGKGKNGIKVNTYQFPDGQEGTKREVDADPATYFDTELNFASYQQLVANTYRFGAGESGTTQGLFEVDNDPESDEQEEEGASAE